MVKIASGVIALIIAIAGALAAMDSFYARKAWTEEQIAGLQMQYALGREDVLERRIFDLEVEKRKMGNKWPLFMEKELLRLKAERDRIKHEIEQLK